MFGQVQDVGELAGGIHRADRLTVQRIAAQNATAPSGSSTPGKTRIPAVSTLSEPIVTSWPMTTPWSIRQCSPIVDARGDDRVHDARSRADPAAIEQHRGLDVRTGGQPHVAPEHGAAADRRVALDHAARAEQRRGVHPALQRGAVVADTATGGDAAPRLGRDLAVEDVVGGLQVALGGADVHPVAARLIAVEAVADQLGEQVALDRAARSRGGHPIQHLALDHVGARADQVGLDLLRPRLLDERPDRAVVVPGDQPVGGGVLDRVQPERDRGPGLLVLAQLRGEVDVGQHVAVEHQKPLVEHRLGELQRSPGPQRLGLLHVAQPHTELRAIAEHRRDPVGHESAGEYRVVDPVALEPLEHVDDERAVHERDDRLGDRAR